MGVQLKGVPPSLLAHLVSKLCASSLGISRVPQTKNVGNFGVGFLSPSLRCYHLPKKDHHSYPNLFSLSLFKRWMKHFLQRGKQLRFQSPQTQFLQSPIPVCPLRVAYCTNWWHRLADQPEELMSETQRQTNTQNNFRWFWWKYSHFNFRFWFSVKFSSSEAR